MKTPSPFKPIPPDQAAEPGCCIQQMETHRWAIDLQWRDAQLANAHAFLRDRIARRQRKVCVIVGNGPSLNHTDLRLLQGQDVIISNNAFLSPELRQVATYYTVVNYLVAEQSTAEINALTGVDKIIPYWLGYGLQSGPNTWFVDARPTPQFNKNLFDYLSWRHTVTFFNLHLAYGLGYRRVVMIGFDHCYQQPPGIAEQAVIQSEAPDVNHFHPDYFRGKAWQAADVDQMAAMYALAKTAFAEDGREIINATVGGCLELFERQSLAQALGVDPPYRPDPMLNIRLANQYFRAGDYENALDLYLRLHQRQPLPMYADNASRAARKLGLNASFTELMQRRQTASPAPFVKT